jgi:uncharacterized protein YpmB
MRILENIKIIGIMVLLFAAIYGGFLFVFYLNYPTTTEEEYDALQIGMTLEETIKIIGEKRHKKSD